MLKATHLSSLADFVCMRLHVWELASDWPI